MLFQFLRRDRLRPNHTDRNHHAKQKHAPSQIVAWVEDPSGAFVDTAFITQQTGTFGLGNRPGRPDFNSGPLWPYGRRITTFPVWAHRHGLAFDEVVFQDGDDSNLSHAFQESSRERHYCRPLISNEAMWDAVIAVHLKGTFLCSQAAAKQMIAQGSGGRIVNTTSVSGMMGNFGQTNYSAAKAGIIGFTKALAQETAKKGITVNVIAPGYIDTEMVQAVPPKVLEGIIATIPVGRLGKADEIAKMVCFLAADDCGFVTGATMTVNGAQYIAG